MKNKEATVIVTAFSASFLLFSAKTMVLLELDIKCPKHNIPPMCFTGIILLII